VPRESRLLNSLACLDTCQLAAAAWEEPNYQLDTIAAKPHIQRTASHRVLDDALATKAIFDWLVQKLGQSSMLAIAHLLALHWYQPTWPVHPRRLLPGPLYDALTGGQPIAIHCVNGVGKASLRMIRPFTCFHVGRHVYVKAHCSKTAFMRRLARSQLAQSGQRKAAASTGLIPCGSCTVCSPGRFCNARNLACSSVVFTFVSSRSSFASG